MIVSNADIQNTVFNLAGAENFSKGYVDYVKGLEYSWTGPVVRVATDEVVTDIKMLSQIGTLDQRAYYDQMMAGKMPEQMNLFLVSPSNFSPSCAPEGKQLINFATMVPIDVPQNISDELPEAMLATAERYIPNIREHIMWMESFSVKDIEKVFGEHGVGIGVAQVPGQVGAKRPKIKTEIEGLYIVGGEAGGSGVGTEMCMNSALEFADNYLD
ncbi:MAG: hypothetical protein LBM21_03310 [Coriobacteriales bacterium]|jgi:prolycopene isomerase|nr:hypothetical protein [Coriobacteriales bacterium]